jgi:hypothetical protein
MTTRKGPKISRDPKNPRTVILDRWPTKDEKFQFAQDVKKARKGRAPRTVNAAKTAI